MSRTVSWLPAHSKGGRGLERIEAPPDPVPKPWTFGSRMIRRAELL